MRTRATLAAVLALAAPADRASSTPSATPDEPACVEAGLLDRGLAPQVERALEVLRQSGYDPARYRLELGLEPGPPLEPGAPRRVFVLFAPSPGPDEAHALIVSSEHPCEVAWVWDPGRFTAWQRRAVERVVRALREAGHDPAETLEDVSVTESAPAVRVTLRLGEGDEAERVEVVLAKPGLELLGYSLDGAR